MNPRPSGITHWQLPSATPSRLRQLALFGGQVEVWWLPERAQRRGARPRLWFADRAPAIVAQEAVWHCDDPPAVVTPNRYPFARGAAILWSTQEQREASAALLELAFALADEAGGTAMMNTVGAAATQPRAHVHVVRERLPFLTKLPVVPVAASTVGDGQWDDVEFTRLAPPFPGLVLGVRGARRARAVAAARLLAVRVPAAANVITAGDTTWFVPRRLETPAPHFPLPLGCAEVWGRFCFEDEGAFAAADAGTLTRALAGALWPSEVGGQT